MTHDLKIWLETLAEEGAEWTPERFEFAFGLTDTAGRDEHSTAEAARDRRPIPPARLDRPDRAPSQDRVPARHRPQDRQNRTKGGQTIVDGGRVLQPVIYGLALEGARVRTRPFIPDGCSSARPPAASRQHEIPLLGEAPARGLEVLEIIDRAIEHGMLAARPAADACAWCDFQVVCGRDEERRTRRKDAKLFADLDALRKMP